MFQKDIASYYKITPSVVSKLVREAEDEPTKNDELEKDEEELEARDEQIKRAVNIMLESRVHIKNAEMVV